MLLDKEMHRNRNEEVINGYTVAELGPVARHADSLSHLDIVCLMRSSLQLSQLEVGLE